MHQKRFLLAALAVFVFHSAAGYLVHGRILGSEYGALPFFRDFADFSGRLPVLYLANLILATAMCFIYTRAYDPEQHWALQGLVFGGLMAALFLPAAMVGYVVLPLPGTLVAKVAVLNSMHLVLSGLVAAAVYR